MATFNEAVTINGTLAANQLQGPLQSVTQLPVRGTSVIGIPLTRLRVWDAFATNLPGTASSDDLGLLTGTFATARPYVATSTGTTTQYARFEVQLPFNYKATGTVTLRFAAGSTGSASTSVTVDCEAYLSSRDTLITGSDLVTTAAQSISGTTYGNKDFSLTASGLNPGDWLDVRVTIAKVDAGTVVSKIAHIELLCDTQG